MEQGENCGDSSAKHPTPSSSCSSSPRPFSHSRLHSFQFPYWNAHRLLGCGNPGASFGADKEVDAATAQVRPWNLRKRRMACGGPARGDFPPPPSPKFSSPRSPRPESGENEAVAAMMALAVGPAPSTASEWILRTRNSWKRAGLPPLPKSLLSPSQSPAFGNKGRNSIRLRSKGREKEEEEWPKFSIQLSKKEIEEDFLMLMGKKPSWRPKMRPKNVQKQLDLLFPGNLLSNITPDSYRIVDNETKW